MPSETLYNVPELLLFLAELYTMFAFLFENTVVAQICPNSLLYIAVPVSIIGYFYAYNIVKINKPIVHMANIIIFFTCAIFFLIQICSICNTKLLKTWSYIATTWNFLVFSWFGCANIKKLSEDNNTNIPIATSINDTQYRAIEVV
jgi:hypothetical protein